MSSVHIQHIRSWD